VEVHGKDDSGIVLTVRDTGVGMASSRLQTVRDHFLKTEAMAVYENTAVASDRDGEAVLRIDSHHIGDQRWDRGHRDVPLGADVLPTTPPAPSQAKALYFFCNPITSELTRKVAVLYGFDIVAIGDITQSLNMDGFEVFLVDCAEDGSTMK
jgi:hypothetical protein